jgi:hypothetical protein
LLLYRVSTTDCYHQGDSYWESRINITPVNSPVKIITRNFLPSI